MLCPKSWGGNATSRFRQSRRWFGFFLGARRARAAGERMRLIGVLMGFAESDPSAQSLVAAFRAALAKLGWTEGSNLRIELHWGAADPNKIGTLAKELVDLRPDVIFGQSTPVIGALSRETRTIPIVFAVVADPIASGFVASLARPSGNITGFTWRMPHRAVNGWSY